ncbi:MAG: hypothetical protein K2X27_17665 [Candidatus Obscuribacterales bacterium]|nr:hypothetical protein [Candidatus Obscuribacterales bacterium]
MKCEKKWTAEESGAFLELFELGPWSGGSLKDLKFAVSDFIDIEERITGTGNPNWAKERSPAAANALLLDILFASGAQCVGRTKISEFSIGLTGENNFYAEVLNPKANERVAGGPAGGAASAAACELVDFSVALDGGCFAQMGAGNCGLYAWKAAYGSVPMAGILPLAPSFDSVSFLTSKKETLITLSQLFSPAPSESKTRANEIVLLSDAWSVTNLKLRNALQKSLAQIKQKTNLESRELSLKQISSEDGFGDLQNWYQAYSELSAMEAWSSLGTWLEQRKPELGEEAQNYLHRARMLDRSESAKYFKRKESFKAELRSFLADDKVLCIPAATEIAPLKGLKLYTERAGNYYPAIYSLASIGAIGHLPQLTIPAAELNGVPAALTFMAVKEQTLIELIKQL